MGSRRRPRLGGAGASQPKTRDHARALRRAVIHGRVAGRTTKKSLDTLDCVPQYCGMTRDEVKQIRKRLELTQTQLAEQVGVTQNTVARWEMGVYSIPEPTARLIERLAAEGRATKRKP
jgi:DNA-binding transcriptional regulator YiaG